jgi:hypothetical protein
MIRSRQLVLLLPGVDCRFCCCQHSAADADVTRILLWPEMSWLPFLLLAGLDSENSRCPKWICCFCCFWNELLLQMFSDLSFWCYYCKKSTVMLVTLLWYGMLSLMLLHV